MKWNGERFIPISYGNMDSRYFGRVKPLKDDPYQALAVDSFVNNKITLIKGPAGSGKSFLSLSYLFHLLEINKIDKIIVFCNTVATKGAARLGFYPGTREEKLMDSQIGNFLSSKLGDRSAVEQLMQQEKILLLPMSDIRGYDTTGMNAGIYITEAQNLDISLMKLAIQRIGKDCVCIIDGDQKT
jgi:predicted ribonuclease YlaK